MTWTTCTNPDCNNGYVNNGRDPQWDDYCPVCGGDDEVWVEEEDHVVPEEEAA